MGTPYVTTQQLRFCDTDQLGHVNNAVYAVMLEAGRAELMQRAGFLDPTGPVGVVIVRLEIDFLREMNWPAEVRIETAIVAFGTKSIRMRQRITLGADTTARAATVIAILDKTTRKAMPLTPAWREALSPWLVADFE